MQFILNENRKLPKELNELIETHIKRNIERDPFSFINLLYLENRLYNHLIVSGILKNINSDLREILNRSKFETIYVTLYVVENYKRIKIWESHANNSVKVMAPNIEHILNSFDRIFEKYDIKHIKTFFISL